MEKYGKAGQATDDNIIWLMRFASRITKERTQKHSQNISILIACPQQKWLQERNSLLRSTYIACFVWPCTLPLNTIVLI